MTKIIKTNIHKHTEFTFAYEKNAENVGIALMKAGFYVKLRFDSSKWTLEVFTDRI